MNDTKPPLILHGFLASHDPRTIAYCMSQLPLSRVPPDNSGVPRKANMTPLPKLISTKQRHVCQRVGTAAIISPFVEIHLGVCDGNS